MCGSNGKACTNKGDDGRMEITDVLQESGALIEGHFLLSSKKHSSHYIQCAKLFERPELGDLVGETIAQRIEKHRPSLVIGPAMGGIIPAYTVARALNVRAAFTERVNDAMMLRRGFRINKGERVAVVEDVVTTGRSAMEVIELVKESGGTVCCVAAVANRSKKLPEFGVPFHYLARLEFPIYEAKDCPLCKQGIPLVKPGSRES